MKEDILRPKMSLSPNMRYNRSETNYALSPCNPVVITDELKFSNSDSYQEEKGSSGEDLLIKVSSREESQKSEKNLSGKLESIAEDSLCEYQEAQTPQEKDSPQIKTDPILFSVQMNEDQIKDGGKLESLRDDETKFIIPKLEIKATPKKIKTKSRARNTGLKASKTPTYPSRKKAPNYWLSGSKKKMEGKILSPVLRSTSRTPKRK